MADAVRMEPGHRYPLTLDVTVDDEFFKDQAPDAVALIVFYPEATHLRVCGLIRSTLTGEDDAALGRWIGTRARRFIEHGPDPDGWRLRITDGGWQLVVRVANASSVLAQLAGLLTDHDAPAEPDPDS